MHTCHISLKADFSPFVPRGFILSSPNSQMTGGYWNLSFFSLSPSFPFLCEAVKGGMCCDGRRELVQTEPVVCRPTVNVSANSQRQRAAHLSPSPADAVPLYRDTLSVFAGDTWRQRAQASRTERRANVFFFVFSLFSSCLRQKTCNCGGSGCHGFVFW